MQMRPDIILSRSWWEQLRIRIHAKESIERFMQIVVAGEFEALRKQDLEAILDTLALDLQKRSGTQFIDVYAKVLNMRRVGKGLNKGELVIEFKKELVNITSALNEAQRPTPRPAPEALVPRPASSPQLNTRLPIPVPRAPPSVVPLPQPPREWSPLELNIQKCLSPLHTLVRGVSSKRVTRQGYQQLDVTLGPDAFDVVKNRKGRLFLTLMDGPNAVAWPKAREFYLTVGDRLLPDTEIPPPWCNRKGEVPMNAKILATIDVTTQIKTMPGLKILLQNRSQPGDKNPNSQGFQNPMMRCEMIFFVASVSEPSVLAQVVAETASRLRWRDTTMGESCAEDDICDSRQVISLRCPFSYCPIKTPVRCRPCKHGQVVDLLSCLTHVHRNRVWRCPICDSPFAGLRDILVDEQIEMVLRSAGPQGAPAKVIMEADGTVTTDQTCQERMMPEISSQEDDQENVSPSAKRICLPSGSVALSVYPPISPVAGAAPVRGPPRTGQSWDTAIEL